MVILALDFPSSVPLLTICYQSKDSSYHYVHLKQPRLTDLFEVNPSLVPDVLFAPAWLSLVAPIY